MSFEDLHRPLSNAGFRGAVRWIITLSGLILIAQQFAGQWLVPYLGLVPARVVDHFWLWQPFTYLFLHGGLFHWLFNMFILWMFGAEIERRWGTVEFLKFFFGLLTLGDVAAGKDNPFSREILVHEIITERFQPDIVSVGVQAAIFQPADVLDGGGDLFNVVGMDPGKH